MKLSKHSKKRLSERTDLPDKNFTRFFRAALDHGLCAGQAENRGYAPCVVNYLRGRNKYTRAKIYKGYVFVYSKSNKVLYTVFKAPDNIIKSMEETERALDS